MCEIFGQDHYNIDHLQTVQCVKSLVRVTTTLILYKLYNVLNRWSGSPQD